MSQSHDLNRGGVVPRLWRRLRLSARIALVAGCGTCVGVVVFFVTLPAGEVFTSRWAAVAAIGPLVAAESILLVLLQTTRWALHALGTLLSLCIASVAALNSVMGLDGGLAWGAGAVLNVLIPATFALVYLTTAGCGLHELHSARLARPHL